MKERWIEHEGGSCPLQDDAQYVEIEGKIGRITCPAFAVKWAKVKRYKLANCPD